MRRKLRSTIVHAKAFTIVNGKTVEEQLEPVIYTGRKKTDSVVEKMFRDRLPVGKECAILITGREQDEKTFECKLEDFLKIAYVVDENTQDVDKEDSLEL